MTDPYEQVDQAVSAINEYVAALEYDLKVMNKGSYRALGVQARRLERTIYKSLGAVTIPPRQGEFTRIRYTDNPTK